MNLSSFRPYTILIALRRAKKAILSVAIVYVIFLLIGIAMVSLGYPLALNFRDNLIRNAESSDSTLIAYNRGDRLLAAGLDFSANLLLGAVPNTLGGLGVVFPYPVIAYRGWVGGIVSVDNQHVSRLTTPNSAIYYLVTLILQLIPYTLAGGVGVNLGLALWRTPEYYGGRRVFGLPREAVLDVFRVYILIVPLFLVASLWEFLI